MKKILSNKFICLAVVILIIASFFRFYNLSKTLMFLDDQARDVLKAAKILKELDIPFIGPMASTGNVYLGPIYYWAIAPFLALSGFNPVGPVIMVALLDVAACLLLFWLLKKIFGLWPAFFAALLYSLSPLMINMARFSWNPNPVPLFTLIWFFFILKFLKKARFSQIFGVGFALGILIQLHYVTGLLFLFTGLIIFYWVVKNKAWRKIDFLGKVIGFLILGMLIPLVPFLLFEIKNYFINTQAAFDLIFGSNNVSALPTTYFGRVNLFVTQLVGQAWALKYGLWFLLFCLISLLKGLKEVQKRRVLILIAVILFLPIFLTPLMLPGNEIHLHYLGFIMPFLFMMPAVAIYVWNKQLKGTLKAITIIVCLIIAVNCLKINWRSIVETDSNHQVDRAKDLADYIAVKAEEKNIFVTSLTGSPFAYPTRYYLYLQGFDAHSDKAKTIFAICDGGGCNPEGHALWEIAQFGQLKTIDHRHVAYGTWIYQLEKKQ